MADLTWNDGTADWNTPGDWSDPSGNTGKVPGAGDDATVTFEGGDPQVTTNVGTVASLTDQGEVDVLSGGTLAVAGNLSPTNVEGGNGGILDIDASRGAANATLTVGGALVDSVQPPTSLEPEPVVFNQLSLTGGTSSQAALTFTTAAAGIGGGRRHRQQQRLRWYNHECLAERQRANPVRQRHHLDDRRQRHAEPDRGRRVHRHRRSRSSESPIGTSSSTATTSCWPRTCRPKATSRWATGPSSTAPRPPRSARRPMRR